MTMQSVEKRRIEIKKKSDNKGETKSDNKCDHESNNKSNSKCGDDFETVEIRKYFAISSSLVVIFNSLCSILSALYCIYLIIDPPFDDKMIYFKHNSYYLRISSTVCWYIGTISVIWFFNGRLFYAFKGSVFNSSKQLFHFINIFVSVLGFVSLIAAYSSVYLQSVFWAEISFTSFRITYQIITFILLFMFSKRLLILTIQGQTMPIIQRKQRQCTNTKGVEMIIHPEKTANPTTNQSLELQIAALDIDIRSAGYTFLEVTARNSVLVFITSTSVALVTILWSAFRWLFLPPTRLTLLMPMNMASIDSLINSISIIMLFPFGDKLYVSLCCCCQKCFTFICVRIAKTKIANELNVLYLDDLNVKSNADHIRNT